MARALVAGENECPTAGHRLNLQNSSPCGTVGWRSVRSFESLLTIHFSVRWEKAVGLIMRYISMMGAAIFITSWNLISWGPEYYILKGIYDSYPQLHTRSSELAAAESPAPRKTISALICEQWIVFFRGWKVQKLTMRLFV
jgi:hypothetical protein